MARRPRLQFHGAVYHVMSRGNRKAPIFDDDDDRRRFLDIVRRTTVRYGVKCRAYCLMENHYHLILETPRANVSQAMRYINGVYAQTSNRRHGRTGHVFEGRFRSIIVDSDVYLQRLARYIVRNPVKAGLVDDVAAWVWSSYRATAGLEALPQFLDIEWIVWTFTAESIADAQATYRQFVTELSISNASRLDIDPFAPSAKRKSSDVVVPLVQPAGRALAYGGSPPPRPDLPELFSKTTTAREHRDAMIHDAHVVHGYRLAEIAAFLRVHPSAASAAVRRLELRAASP